MGVMRVEIDRAKAYWAHFNCFELRLTGECVLDCAASGPVDDAVAYWAEHVERLDRCTPDAIRVELAEYGAWDSIELSDDTQNWKRIIWIAANNVADSEELDEAS